MLWDAAGFQIADFGGNHKRPIEERRANARLAVQAVNNHDALVSALREMVDMFARKMNNEPGPDDAAQRWDAARQALADVEGGTE